MERNRLRSAIRTDPFVQLRTEAELDQLVAEVSARSETPLTDLIELLVGARPINESLAGQAWSRARKHREEMAAALGRPIHLRVAALDLAMCGRLGSRVMVLERGTVDTLLSEATTDPLTELANRRYFAAVLQYELRQRRHTTVAMIDVDSLKQLNDTQGHARGDEVLKGLAGILRANTRRGDVAARLGGDEFAVLFADAGEDASQIVLRRVEATFRREYGALGVGLSSGLAEAAGPGTTVDELLAAADRRMYDAKQGRGAEARAEPDAVAATIVYVTQRPDRIVALGRVLGERGVMLLPTSSPEDAAALASLIEPLAVLADLMHPPRGGIDALERLGLGRAQGQRVALVAPAGWLGVRKGLPPGVELLPYPPNGAAIQTLLRGRDAPTAAPLPELESEEQADALLDAIGAALAGHPETAAAGLAAGRPELQLVISRLASPRTTGGGLREDAGGAVEGAHGDA